MPNVDAGQPLEFEIFGTGEWHGQVFTRADLDAMVRNFELLHGAIRPPIKLGHSDQQMLALQADGQPALGWVSGLRRHGDKLHAAIQDMPVLLQDLIRGKRYDRVSAELYPAFEATSAEKNLKSGAIGPVLSGIALLGADVPEVKTLEDLHQALLTEGIDAVCSFTEPAAVQIRDAVLSIAREPGPLRGVRQPSTGKPSEAATPSHKETATMADDPKKPEDAVLKLQERLTALEAESAAKDLRMKEQAEELTRIRDAATLERVARRHEAAGHYAEKVATGPQARINAKQQPLAAWFHEHLDDTAEFIPADQAKAMGLGETGLTQLAAFTLFVDCAPAVSTVLRTGEQTTTPAVPEGLTLTGAMEKVAKERNLDLGKFTERKQVLGIIAKEYPGLVPSYTQAAS